jgi:hypothetical protein
MAITMNDLTINPSQVDMENLLTEWEWAMPEPMRPVLLTAMGDVFAQGDSKGVFLLDVVGGCFEKVAENGDEFQNLLRNVQFVTDKLLPARILQLRKSGKTLGPNEVYSHKHPLVLGGEDTDENTEVTDVSVHISIHGQIHRQVKDLPDGTSIEDIQIE